MLHVFLLCQYQLPIINHLYCGQYTVTMQAQRVAPPNMQCKDKFLIQSTVVPYGTTETDIRSDMVRISGL